MKSLASALFMISAALAATSEIPTIRSTIISSTSCTPSQVAPSSFIYANVSSFAPLSTTYNVVDVSSAEPTSTSKDRSTIYEYDTATLGDIFQVTRTVCQENSVCYVTTELESSTTYTTTVDGILTVITTAVPISTTQESTASTTASTPLSSPSSTIGKTTLYAYETESFNDIVEVTHTVCDAKSHCYVTTDLESSTTYTTTVDGILTTITTCLPLTSETAATSAAATTTATSVASSSPLSEEESITTETLASTTVLTITSCSHYKCSKVTQTTGLTVITKDTTIYTTYCPLSTETSSTESSETPSDVSTTEPKPESTSIKSTSIKSTSNKSTETATSAHEIPLTTINVITNNIITETPSSTTLIQQTSSAKSPTVTVATYEGAADSIIFAKSTGLIGILLSLAFMII